MQLTAGAHVSQALLGLVRFHLHSHTPTLPSAHAHSIATPALPLHRQRQDMKESKSALLAVGAGVMMCQLLKL